MDFPSPHKSSLVAREVSNKSFSRHRSVNIGEHHITFVNPTPDGIVDTQPTPDGLHHQPEPGSEQKLEKTKTYQPITPTRLPAMELQVFLIIFILQG